MNIFVPFTQLRAETFNAMFPMYGVTLVPLLDETAYSRYFIRRWNEEKTFINVEHDVVATEAQLRELWECSHSWCVFGYTPTDASAYLGCAKFSAEFIRNHPDMWYERPWGNCDVHLADLAMTPVHYHRGSVVRHIK